MRLTLSLLAIWPFTAFADIPANIVSPDVTFFESGIACDPPSVAEQPAPNTVAGFTSSFIEDVDFVSNTHVVPAVLGLSFGVKTQMRDAAGLIDATMTVTHPPMGPDKVTRQFHTNSISGQSITERLYAFDFEYELLLGTWQLEAKKDGKIIYRATFEVVSPSVVPDLAAICGFEDLLS